MILLSLARKEALLLSRDRHALAVLFLMPTLFVLLMAFALAEVNQDRLPPLPVALENADQGPEAALFAAALAAQLGAPATAGDDARLPRVRLHDAFAERMQDDAQRSLTLVFPATVDAPTRQRLRGAADLALAQTRLAAFLTLSGELDDDAPLAERLAAVQARTASRIEEQALRADGSLGLRANASQHSVPAWLIFGMFFVMLPMAYSFQQERQSGTLMRFRCLGLGLPTLALSKLLPYLAINLLQFALLLALGRWGLPLLGLPGLTLDGSLPAYVLLAASLACGACSLGLLVATLTRTAEQALLLSGGLNIILAAVGGIMVPKSVMPAVMTRVADLSPMSWGLDAFLLLLVGQGGVAEVAPDCARLLVFALLAGSAGVLLFRKRLNDTQWTTQD